MKKIMEFTGSVDMMIRMMEEELIPHELRLIKSGTRLSMVILEDAPEETKVPIYDGLTPEEREELGFLPKDMKITRVDSESDDELRWNERRIDVIGQNGEHRDSCVDCQAEAEGYNGEND